MKNKDYLSIFFTGYYLCLIKSNIIFTRAGDKEIIKFYIEKNVLVKPTKRQNNILK